MRRGSYHVARAQDCFPAVFRGLGLDFANAGGGARSEAIAAKAFDLGVIAETCGRNDEVRKLMPPLTIAGDVLRRGLDVIEAAIAAVPVAA